MTTSNASFAPFERRLFAILFFSEYFVFKGKTSVLIAPVPGHCQPTSNDKQNFLNLSSNEKHVNMPM